MKGCQVLPPWKQRYLHCLFFVFKISSHAEGEGGSLCHPGGMILEERREARVVLFFVCTRQRYRVQGRSVLAIQCGGKFCLPDQGNNKEERRRKIVLSRGNCKQGATHVKAGHRAVQRTFWMRSLSDDNACLTIS